MLDSHSSLTISPTPTNPLAFFCIHIHSRELQSFHYFPLIFFIKSSSAFNAISLSKSLTRSSKCSWDRVTTGACWCGAVGGVWGWVRCGVFRSIFHPPLGVDCTTRSSRFVCDLVSICVRTRALRATSSPVTLLIGAEFISNWLRWSIRSGGWLAFSSEFFHEVSAFSLLARFRALKRGFGSRLHGPLSRRC